ncbi:MAG TPA: hypothetical protein VEU96_02300, partial [Bryobacteraceae bacterium]|nr:hypothetical protein [Bryobacteraceae bacterium]
MWVTKRTAPKAVARYWGTLIDARDKPVQAIAENATLGQAVLQLCAVADEASEGVGSPLDGHETEIEERFQFHASGLLDRDSPGSSLCEEINVTRLRVLPKMHTPQTGLTVRSLSHYLALCEPSEVVPYWIQSMSPLRDDSMNLLVVPWPFEIYPVQFRAAVPLQNEMRNMPDRFGFFTFDQRDSGDVVEAVSKLYDSALEQVGRIDGVVLPELALTEQERIDLRSFALQKNAFLVSGFGSSSQGGTRCGENQVGLDFRGVLDVTLSQRKHHRWKLDSSQVSQYRLGSLLYPEKEWWE